jgi:hypothetical protein
MTTDAAYLTAVLAAYDDPVRRAAVLRAAQEQAVKPRPVGIREAARVLGCHPKTVQRYAMQGRLRQIHISPRRVRYDLNEVEALATRGVSSTPK